MRTPTSPKAGSIAMAVIALAMCASVSAEEKKLKETTKEAGHAIGTAAKEVGHGTKSVTKEAGKAIADVAREVGHAFRDGAKEVKKAATSESEPAKPAGPKK